MTNNYILRDEIRLLLELCRLDFTDSAKTTLAELIGKVVDWDYFSKMSNLHGIAALVYHNLDRLGLLLHLPVETVDYLHGRLLISISRNTFNMRTLIKTLMILEEESIKTVLIKGMALELSVYGNKGLRQMSDVDVLLTKDDCMKASYLLAGEGYFSLPMKSRLHKKIVLEIGKHLPSMIKDGFSFELHHELFGKENSVATKRLYDNAEVLHINGQECYIPAPRSAFIYLVRHLSLHEMKNESQLRLYTDLVILIHRYGNEIINGDLILMAIEGGIAGILANRLMVIKEFWGMEFQDNIEEFIARESEKEFLDRFLFFLESPKENPVDNPAMLYRYQLRGITGAGRKALYVMGDIFPSLSFMKKRYNCRYGFMALFYYPHRLGKLLYLLRTGTNK